MLTEPLRFAIRGIYTHASHDCGNPWLAQPTGQPGHNLTAKSRVPLPMPELACGLLAVLTTCLIRPRHYLCDQFMARLAGVHIAGWRAVAGLLAFSNPATQVLPIANGFEAAAWNAEKTSATTAPYCVAGALIAWFNPAVSAVSNCRIIDRVVIHHLDGPGISGGPQTGENGLHVRLSRRENLRRAVFDTRRIAVALLFQEDQVVGTQHDRYQRYVVMALQEAGRKSRLGRPGGAVNHVQRKIGAIQAASIFGAVNDRKLPFVSPGQLPLLRFKVKVRLAQSL